MTVTVRSPSSRSIAVTQGNQTQGAVVVKRAGDLTVQSLSNVVSTDLQDGYTLVYDSETKKWIAQQITGDVVQTIDGGTY